MNALDQVSMRLQALLGQLDFAEKALDSEGIDKNLRNRVGHVLRKNIEKERHDVQAALNRIHHGTTKPHGTA
jgi:hypothetical protein